MIINEVRECPDDCEFNWRRFHDLLDQAAAHLVTEHGSLLGRTSLLDFIDYSSRKSRGGDRAITAQHG